MHGESVRHERKYSDLSMKFDRKILEFGNLKTLKNMDECLVLFGENGCHI